MFERYGRPARRWRSVTPVALPVEVARRRIEPARRADESKGGAERIAEERRAVRAVAVALRHAGIRTPAVAVTVQREPFAPRDTRAELFAADTRFAKERLWHVEVELGEPVAGPLVLGDGRFLGLGLMVPVTEPAGLYGFTLGVDPAAVTHPDGLVHAARRAVMSRAQEVLGKEELGPFFSGHELDGKPARTAQSGHIAVQWDPTAGRLLVIAPHVLDHRRPNRDEWLQLRRLAEAIEGFVELRAGRAGRFQLTRCAGPELEAYAARATQWLSVRPYAVTRHGKTGSAETVLADDVIFECQRRGLPRPRVTVLGARGVAGRGLEGTLRLEFATAVGGPILLGKTRYCGGGLFVPAPAPVAPA
jgi:CRISPR-associated protein Csb2